MASRILPLPTIPIFSRSSHPSVCLVPATGGSNDTEVKTKAKKPTANTRTAEKEREAKALAEIRLHEKLQALIESDDDGVKTIGFMIDTAYRMATENGGIVTSWRRISS